MVVPPDNVSFYGGGFKPDSSELYYDIMPHGVPDPVTTLYQVPVLGDTPRKILDAVTGPVSFTPDGKRFVFSRLNPATGAAQLVSANSGDGSEVTIVAEGTYNVDFRAPNFSPDGTTILFVAGQRRDDGWYWHIGEIPAAGGERKMLCEPRKQRLWGATWLGTTGDILVNAQAPDTKNSQLFIMPRGTGELTRLTNDLNNYSGLSATADGTKIVVTQDQRMNDIWVWSGNDAEKPRKITNQSVIIHSCTWTPSGRVIYNILENGKDLLWSTGSDGTGRTQLTSADVEGDFADASPDGRFVLYVSNRSGSWQLWRMNADGSGAKQLTPDSESPVRGRFALGGSKIIFERRLQDETVLAFMDIDGGPPQDITEQYIGDWSTTNDGRMVVYEFYDKPSGKYRTAVRSLEDLNQVKYLDLLPKDFVILSPDGRYVLTKRNEPGNDPMSTIWAFPVDGGEPKKVLQNAPDNIYWAEYADDNKNLAIVQGRVISNLILFTRSAK
jgi:Tol biopolymer transport system component